MSPDFFGEFAPIGRPAHTLTKGIDGPAEHHADLQIRENGETIGALPDGEMMFHHDTIHRDEPHKGTLLYSVEIPTYGGDTLFASGTAAYDTLDPAMKQKLEGLRAVNYYVYNSVKRDDKQARAMPRAKRCIQSCARMTRPSARRSISIA